MTRNRFRIPILLLAVTLLAAGCGDDDDDDASDDTTETTAPEDGGTIEVTAVDYGYEGIPSSVSSGTTFSLTNASDVEIHEMVAFLLPEDETRPVDELAQLPEEELGGLFAGEPNFVLLAPPSGADQIPAVGDGSVTAAGRYVVFCAIPTGADPAEFLDAAANSEGGPPEVEGGPPHFTQGMYAEFTVE